MSRWGIPHRRRGSSSPAPVPRRPAGKADGWALTGVADHVTFAAGRMTAWYLADPQTWSFRSVAEGEELIRDHAAGLAELVGTTVFGRVTYRPYPVSHWARAHWDNAPDPQPGFAEMVDRDQVHMSSSAQADKLVYYGVDLGERGTLTAALGQGGRRGSRAGTRSTGAPVGGCGSGDGRRRPGRRPVVAGGYGVAAGPLVRPRLPGAGARPAHRPPPGPGQRRLGRVGLDRGTGTRNRWRPRRGSPRA